MTGRLVRNAPIVSVHSAIGVVDGGEIPIDGDRIVEVARGMNGLPVLPDGDPVHAVVLYADTADADTVMIAGRIVKRSGRLRFPGKRLAGLQESLPASRLRITGEGNRVYTPAPKGPRP